MGQTLFNYDRTLDITSVLTGTAQEVLSGDGIFRGHQIFCFFPGKDYPGYLEYLTLKATENNPITQHRLLSEYVEAAFVPNPHDAIYRSGREFFLDNPDGYKPPRHSEPKMPFKEEFTDPRTWRPNPKTGKIDHRTGESNIKAAGGSLGRINLFSPHTVQDAFGREAAELYSRGVRPILKAYSGVLGLVPFVAQLPVGGEMYIVLPNYLIADANSPQLSEVDYYFIGYKIMKPEMGKAVVGMLTASYDFEHANLAIVRFSHGWTDADKAKEEVRLENFFKENSSVRDVEIISVIDRIRRTK